MAKSKAEKAAYDNQWRIDNKERIKARARQYLVDHKEERRAYSLQYMADHKENVTAYQRQWDADNKAEQAEKDRQYRLSHKAQSAANHRKYRSRPEVKTHRREKALVANIKRYGITPAEYEALLIAQGGVCAVCGAGKPKRGRFNIDHDHITGKVRGLLCHRCNVGIGFFGDSVGLLQKAIEYIRMSIYGNV